MPLTIIFEGNPSWELNFVGLEMMAHDIFLIKYRLYPFVTQIIFKQVRIMANMLTLILQETYHGYMANIVTPITTYKSKRNWQIFLR